MLKINNGINQQAQWITAMLVKPFQRGDRLYTAESDVCRRQILPYKYDHRAGRIEIFLMDVDAWHRYSNASETANWNISNDFKYWKKPFGLHGL